MVKGDSTKESEGTDGRADAAPQLVVREVELLED
jgi:hypothetical protein